MSSKFSPPKFSSLQKTFLMLLKSGRGKSAREYFPSTSPPNSHNFLPNPNDKRPRNHPLLNRASGRAREKASERPDDDLVSSLLLSAASPPQNPISRPRTSAMDQHQQQQLAAILGADPAPFEALIAQLMSSANDQRSQAESLFHLCRDLQTDALAAKLATLLHSSPHLEIRAMSAILLRKLLTRDSSPSPPTGDSSSPSYLWPRLSPASQASLKTLLLASVQREDAKSISKKLCDTVSEIAAGLLPDDAWPELLPFMFQSVTSDNPRLQESALLIFSQLAQYIGDTLLPHLPTLHSVLLSSLSHPTSADVRIAALGDDGAGGLGRRTMWRRRWWRGGSTGRR